MLKKTILIVIASDLFIRHYLNTDALEEIENNYDCYFIASESISQKQKIEEKNSFKGYYLFDKKLERKHYKLFNILMWRNRNISSSFKFRIKRMLPSLRLKYLYNIALVAKQLFTFVKISLPELIPMILFGNRRIFDPYYKFYIKHLPVNESLRMHIEKIKPDIILFPSSAYDPAGNDVVRISESRNIKTVFLIDNWDNLSSKSIMWAVPDYLSVWGEQSKQHAHRIQSILPNKVTIIGTPRFDQYFVLRNVDIKSHFDHLYVLFVGCAIPFDEASALKSLDEEISMFREIYGNMKIIYRPHPWRQGRDSILDLDLHNVILDPQVLDLYKNPKLRKTYFPDLDYYPSLIKNSEFVVGCLTSMIIESTIFYKHYLALAYDDGKNITSQNNALKYYEHFRGIEKLESVKFCEDKKNIGEKFRETWFSKDKINKERIDAQRKYFLYDDHLSYKRRLYNLVEKLTYENQIK